MSESSTPQSSDFLIQREDLKQCKFVRSALPQLEDGQVLTEIDAFALTANNITYAVLGDSFKYWSFFPGPDGFGRLPVWGFADVVASRNEAVKTGERFWGYWPISTHLVMTPGRANEAGFVDAAPHRKGLPGLYNQYARTATDSAYSAAHEEVHMLLYPLFGTAFLLADFLSAEDFPGADVAVFSSASSKTAFGTARILKEKQGKNSGLIGLTSARNKAFVEGLGFYDEVIEYERIASLPADGTAVYVDFAGSGSITGDVHRHFGDRLLHSCAVGKSHAEAAGAGEDLPGPGPAPFFAPAQGKKAMKALGMKAFQEQMSAAWSRFRDQAGELLSIRRESGEDAVRRAYLETLEGQASSSTGFILSV